jgi:transcriptional regulator with XRE-family HTH domain
MTPNSTLRAIRLGMRMSQDELARAVQEAGRRIGSPNSCSKRLVQRWESGEVAHPRPAHTRALEAVTGMPAASLGFTWPMTAELPEPGPDEAIGAMSGIWLSRYEYPSTSRGSTFLGYHYVALIQTADRLQGRSLPRSSNSALRLDLSVAGHVVTGTWTEHTSQDSYYSGAVYHGAIQLLADPTGRRLAGSWVGFGRNGDVNTGPWTLTLVDASLAKSALAKYDRRPPEAGDAPPDATPAPATS